MPLASHPIKGVASRRAQRRDGTPFEDLIAVEEPLEIRVASEPVSITMRTPGEDAKLAVGFLFAEGIVRSVADLGSVAHCGRVGDEGYGNVIEVSPAAGANLPLERAEAARRGTLTTSACGVCGRRQIDDLLARIPTLPLEATVSAQLLARGPERLTERQQNFARTGGVHAALVLGADGALLAGHEDVGRHNAVDKVVGDLLLSNRLGLGAVLLVSGRSSFEIVQKAAMARLPVVASVSAASTLAIDLAQRAGITLVAFVRGGGFNVYTHPARLIA
ncbi:MAG: mobB FdhD [Myxococcaceae bacterium]|nr:mobB FdhD [Myxococcaceae bacterium]